MPNKYESHPKDSPGSPAAVTNGCTCPVMDNARGAGIGGGHFWIHQGCPIHNNDQDTMPIQEPE